MKYSQRAKKNTRDPINLRILDVRINLTALKSYKKTYERFAKSGNAFAKKALRGIKKNILKRDAQLNRYLSRKDRLKKQGKI
jgi:hypothetical protein